MKATTSDHSRERLLLRLIDEDEVRLARYRKIEAAILARGDSDADAFLAHAKELQTLTIIEQRISRGMHARIKELKELRAELEKTKPLAPAQPAPVTRAREATVNNWPAAAAVATPLFRKSAASQTEYAANPSPCS